MGFKSTKDVQSFDLLLAILYEFLGTFILVAIAIGSGSNAPDDIYPRDTLRTPFTVGLTVATVVWAGSHVSGAHVNPVVSFAFLITHNISLLRFVLFTVSQLLGATTAALFIQSLSPPGFNDLVGVQVLGKGVLWHQGFLIETLTTFLLIFVILATTDDHRSTPKGSGPLTIGLCVTLCQLWSVSTAFFTFVSNLKKVTIIAFFSFFSTPSVIFVFKCPKKTQFLSLACLFGTVKQ